MHCTNIYIFTADSLQISTEMDFTGSTLLRQKKQCIFSKNIEDSINHSTVAVDLSSAMIKHLETSKPRILKELH